MVVDGDLYVSECKKHSKKYIYIACPWAPMGGGMFKIADYLVQSQYIDDRYPELRALDSRGSGLALLSFFVILKALFFIFIGRISGRLVGVHVNVATAVLGGEGDFLRQLAEGIAALGIRDGFATLDFGPFIVACHSEERCLWECSERVRP